MSTELQHFEGGPIRLPQGKVLRSVPRRGLFPLRLGRKLSRPAHEAYAAAYSQLTLMTGCSSFHPQGGAMAQRRPVSAQNSLYCPTVTGILYIQYPSSTTRCTGRSRRSPSSLPIKNSPGGIQISSAPSFGFVFPAQGGALAITSRISSRLGRTTVPDLDGGRSSQ